MIKYSSLFSPLTAAAAVLAVVVLAASPASAGVVATASFESPVLNAGEIQYGPDAFGFNTLAVGPVAISDFTFTGFSGIYKNGALGVFPDTSFGTQSAFLQSYDGTGTPTGGSISWALSGLTAGATYNLSFLATAAFIVPGENFTVSAFGSAPLLIIPTVGYQTYAFDFTALSSSGTIDFVGPAIPVGNFATAIDNITVSTVPEPATLSLLAAGLLGAGALRRRKSSKA